VHEDSLLSIYQLSVHNTHMHTHTYTHNETGIRILLLRLSMPLPFVNGNFVTEKVTGMLEFQSGKRTVKPGDSY
jgi:hypothetical protein